MAHPNETVKAEDRLSIRANSSQKLTLKRAAEARHMNVSQFVLQTSLQAAEQVLAEESRLVVSNEEYEWLCRLMDEPARDLPEIRELLRERPVWDA